MDGYQKNPVIRKSGSFHAPGPAYLESPAMCSIILEVPCPADSIKHKDVGEWRGKVRRLTRFTANRLGASTLSRILVGCRSPPKREMIWTYPPAVGGLWPPTNHTHHTHTHTTNDWMSRYTGNEMEPLTTSMADRDPIHIC